ncbi:MAG TPA: malate dehydrogenase [Dissulfurispiraceae bacterium]|nr:malate dehydrogenase [Dissulfurispiraceae bacterium]
MKTKISIIGAGNVGGSLAHLIVQAELGDVVLLDVDDGVAKGKALDISQAAPLWISSSGVSGTDDFASTANSDIVVITCGYPRKPGMSRDELLLANTEIVANAARKAASFSPDAIFIVVTNPMDAMAQLTMEVSGLPARHVAGMGGILDSARFRTFVAWETGVSPRDVEALVMGGHGDLMVPMPRFTTVKGVPITELYDAEKIESIVQRTRQGGAEIVHLLKHGSAYYAPAAAVLHMIKSVVSDEKRLLVCSAYLNGEYGAYDVYTGVPVILGRDGIDKIIELKLNEQERGDFVKSVEAVKESVALMRRAVK